MATISDEESIFLYLCFIYERKNYEDLFAYLPEDAAETIRKSAGQYMEIPKKQRLIMTLTEMKRLLASTQYHPLRISDSFRIIQVIADENPRTIALLLKYFPEQVSLEVLQQLPPAVTKKLPLITQQHEVSPEIREVITACFQEELHAIAEI